MRHRVFGKKLGRTRNERLALFKGLARALILRGAIVTTQAKAKAVRPLVEKLVTRARQGDDFSRQFLAGFFQNKQVAEKLVGEVAPRFSQRPGGYTRLINLGMRHGDSAPLVQLSWVESAVLTAVSKDQQKISKPKGKSKAASTKQSKKALVSNTV